MCKLTFAWLPQSGLNVGVILTVITGMSLTLALDDYERVPAFSKTYPLNTHTHTHTQILLKSSHSCSRLSPPVSSEADAICSHRSATISFSASAFVDGHHPHPTVP